MNLFDELKALSAQGAAHRPHLVTITMRVHPAVHEQLEELARDLGESQNWVITRLISLAADHKKKEPK